MRAIELAASIGLRPGGVLAITGSEGAGKTQRSLVIVAAAQAAGWTVGHICAGGEPPVYREHGVDPRRLIRCRAREERDALTIATRLAGCGGAELVVLDALGTDELGWSGIAAALKALALAGERGGCRALVIGRAEPFGGVPLGLSLGAGVRLDLGEIEDRLVVRGLPPLRLRSGEA